MRSYGKFCRFCARLVFLKFGGLLQISQLQTVQTLVFPQHFLYVELELSLNLRWRVCHRFVFDMVPIWLFLNIIHDSRRIHQSMRLRYLLFRIVQLIFLWRLRLVPTVRIARIAFDWFLFRFFNFPCNHSRHDNHNNQNDDSCNYDYYALLTGLFKIQVQRRNRSIAVRLRLERLNNYLVAVLPVFVQCHLNDRLVPFECAAWSTVTGHAKVCGINKDVQIQTSLTALSKIQFKRSVRIDNFAYWREIERVRGNDFENYFLLSIDIDLLNYFHVNILAFPEVHLRRGNNISAIDEQVHITPGLPALCGDGSHQQ